MHKRRLVTPRVVGMAMLLMGRVGMGHSCQRRRFVRRRRTTTPSAASATKPSASANEQITRSKATNGSSAETDRANAEGFGGAETASGTTHQARFGHGAGDATGQPAKPATGTGAQPAAQPAQAVATGDAVRLVVTEQASQPHTASLGEVASTSPDDSPDPKARWKTPLHPWRRHRNPMMDTDDGNPHRCNSHRRCNHYSRGALWISPASIATRLPTAASRRTSGVYPTIPPALPPSPIRPT